MKIAVLLGQSEYAVLRIWAVSFGEIFRKYFHEVYFWDLATEPQWPHGNESIDVVFALNGWGSGTNSDGSALNFYEQIPGSMDKKIFARYFVDHPIYHENRLAHKLEHSLSFYVDESFDDFVGSGLNIQTAAGAFLPHPGVKYIPENSRYPKRDIDILFTSTAFFEPVRSFACLENPVLVNLANELIDYLIADKGNISLWEALQFVAVAKPYDLSEFAQNEIILLLYCVDIYLRAFKKHKLLDFVLEKGLRVHVYGNGWQEHPLSNKLLGKEPVGFLAIPPLNARAKVVLSSNCNYTHGSHERVFNALINGAIPLIDGSSYYEKEIPGFFMTVNEEEQLGKILHDENYFWQLSQRAMNIAGRKHNLEARAITIMKYIDEYKRCLNL